MRYKAKHVKTRCFEPRFEGKGSSFVSILLFPEN